MAEKKKNQRFSPTMMMIFVGITVVVIIAMFFIFTEYVFPYFDSLSPQQLPHRDNPSLIVKMDTDDKNKLKVVPRSPEESPSFA